MKTKFPLFLLFISIYIIMCAPASGPIEETPLERPEPLVVVSTNLASTLLHKISDKLIEFNFSIIRLDDKEKFLEASKKDKPTSEDHDKVIIWLERDFEKPYEYIKIFFQYGRYEKILGRDYAIKRIRVDLSYENERVGKLKEAIISIPKTT